MYFQNLRTMLTTDKLTDRHFNGKLIWKWKLTAASTDNNKKMKEKRTQPKHKNEVIQCAIYHSYLDSIKCIFLYCTFVTEFYPKI